MCAAAKSGEMRCPSLPRAVAVRLAVHTCCAQDAMHTLHIVSIKNDSWHASRPCAKHLQTAGLSRMPRGEASRKCRGEEGSPARRGKRGWSRRRWRPRGGGSGPDGVLHPAAACAGLAARGCRRARLRRQLPAPPPAARGRGPSPRATSPGCCSGRWPAAASASPPPAACGGGGQRKHWATADSVSKWGGVVWARTLGLVLPIRCRVDCPVF